MKHLIVVVFLALTSFVFAHPVQQVMSYKLSVKFNPETSLLTGEVEILNPTDSCFSLANGLHIISMKADGNPTLFQKESTDETTATTIYNLGKIHNRLSISFSGKLNSETLPKGISLINGIDNRWIELSERINWIPKMIENASFIYDMEVTTPETFTTICTNEPSEVIHEANHTISRWKSAQPVHNIILFSAAGLKKSSVKQDGANLDIYYCSLPESYVDSMKTDIQKSMILLNQLFGPCGKDTHAKIVYSPRAAGGYARRPLLLVSENYALEQRTLRFGYARDFKLNVHEIAHYWSFANTSTPEDWMNEGLAEYASFLISEKLIGKEFADLLREEYKGIIDHTQTSEAIAETPDESWEREINRYYKPTLLFDQLRQKYGEEKLFIFFQNLCVAMQKTSNRSTDLFLKTMEQVMGKEASDFFREAIYRKGWSTTQTAQQSSLQKADKAIIGKWSGPLTQFGTTLSFVLNLSEKDGLYNPSIESPDQGAVGIPVSDLQINGYQISFRVGMASAIFTGTFDENKNMINGIWTQRGTDYPLSLQKTN